MSTTTSFQQDIEAQIDKFTEAFNNHDAKAYTELFTADADFTNVLGQHVHGKPGIEDLHIKVFAGLLRESKITSTRTRARLLTPHLATADVTWTIDGSFDFHDNPWPDRRGLLSLVMKYEADNWYIISFHNMDFPRLN